METGEISSNNQERINTLNRKIFALKDRIALETDSHIKGKMVSVLLELEEFRKMLESINSYSGKSQPDKYPVDMELNIYSGRRSFRESISGMTTTNR